MAVHHSKGEQLQAARRKIPILGIRQVTPTPLFSELNNVQSGPYLSSMHLYPFMKIFQAREIHQALG